MKWRTLFFSLFLCGKAFAITIAPSHLKDAAEKIWKNECKGTIEGLTCWNKGEDFASLGIGHFIWFPKNHKEPFQETFPALVSFLQEKGAHVPRWVRLAEVCPWNSKEEFEKDFHKAPLCELRQCLFETKELQAQFMKERLYNALPKMTESLSVEEKKQVTSAFNEMASHSHGIYPLLDYLNFKGEGTSPKERYKGQGWGLLQVLLEMRLKGEDCVADFVEAAKTVLTRRVENSPESRNERQWLKGWFNRIESYKRV